MLKKHYIGINPHVANSGSRDQSLTGIGGPRVTLHCLATPPMKGDSTLSGENIQVDREKKDMV